MATETALKFNIKENATILYFKIVDYNYQQRVELYKSIKNYVVLHPNGELNVNFDENLFDDLYKLLCNKQLNRSELLYCLENCFRYSAFREFCIKYNLL